MAHNNKNPLLMMPCVVEGLVSTRPNEAGVIVKWGCPGVIKMCSDY